MTIFDHNPENIYETTLIFAVLINNS